MSDANLPSGFGWAQGIFALQPHVKVPAGTFEEEHARNGFFGRTSHLYHRHPPTGWLKIEGPLKPRAYRAVDAEQEPQAESTLGAFGRTTWLLENADVRMGVVKVTQPENIFLRNADGDEVHFVHQGAGVLQTDYGDVAYRRGDYVVIPRGTTFRFVPQGGSKVVETRVVIESAASEIRLPDRGMLGRHAQFDPMCMRIPELPREERQDGAVRMDSRESPTGREYELQILREGQLTRVTYPWNPLNAVGWKGDLAPWVLNVDDIRPIVSPRFHLPPSVHTTFVGRGFVICSFLPRPFESEDGVEKVPFYHRNIDFDEVLFYHEGNFFSREGISAGAITWHPQGIHHGPHPNAAKNAVPLTETKEIAVMLDTVRPLRATAAASRVEAPEYAMSWRADQKR